jgi:hypothetical protein
MLVVYAVLTAMACFGCYLVGHKDGYNKRLAEEKSSQSLVQ